MLAAAGVVAAAALVGVSFVGADSWEKEFATGMSSPDSNVRAAAVKALDPSVKKARDYLYNVLEKETWYVRLAAMETLARAEGDALADVKKALEKESSPLVRDGIAIALASRRETDLTPAVIGALKDKHPVVRRSAAVALVQCPTKECIPALIEAWEKEKVVEVCAFYREALEKITGKFAGATYGEWQDWWRAVEHDFVVGKKEKDEAEEKKAEEQGKKAAESTTVLRGVELNYKERGAGGPLFVMPEYGMNRTYLEKHLEPIESVARVFYIDLPEASKFKDLQAVGATGMPYYPIDKLVDAFDELRKERKQDQIAIMGHGMSGWIAMRYATRYPKNVSHLILVSTWTSGKAWADGRQRTEVDGKSTKNLEQEHFAQACTVDIQTGKHGYEAKDQAEAAALDRMSFSCYFVDPRDSLLAFFWPAARREMGGVLIPEFDIGKEKGNPVPTLILVGANPRALWTSTQDAQQLAKYYPNASVVPLPGTNRMPMLEDHEAFTKSVKGFFKKFPFKKKMGK
jgi:pimeloyl-ACP methyl ester carboxylesterase